jgi:hypothetical protein
MSVGSTDRFSRSMIILLFSGDNNPLADAIWRGFSAVGVSSIFSETFGKEVVQPLPRLKTNTDRRNNKKDLKMTIDNHSADMEILFFILITSS